MRCIAIDAPLCLSVCLSVCPIAYLKTRMSKLREIHEELTLRDPQNDLT